VHGLFILGQPRLVSSIFHRFAKLFSAKNLVARATAIFIGTFNQEFAPKPQSFNLDSAAGTNGSTGDADIKANAATAASETVSGGLPLGPEVELELGFYYLDLVLQYKLNEADALIVGEAILDIVQTLLDTEVNDAAITVSKLTNRIVGPKLLKYFDTHCSNIKSPELQARYAFLTSMCLGTPADVEAIKEATREGAIDVDPDFLAGNALGLNGVMEGEEDEDEDWYDEEDEDEEDDFDSEGADMFEDEDDPEETEVDYTQ